MLTVVRSADLPAARLAGTAEYRPDEHPALRRVADALYIPNPASIYQGGWGVYFPDGRAVPEAIVRRWVDERPFRHIDRLEAASPPRENVRAPAYYLGPIMGPYGHFLVETVARLWAVPGARPPGSEVAAESPPADGGWLSRLRRLLPGASARDAAAPELYVYHGDMPPVEIPRRYPFMVAIFAALGIAPGQLVRPTRPTRFARMVVPDAAFQARSHMLPELPGLSRLIAERVLGGPVTARTARPLYLSKRRLRSSYTKVVNEGAIEEALRAAGAEIVSPETLSFREQVALINRHDTIVGTVGSAFHTILYALDRKRLHYVVPGDQVNSNYPLIDRAMGHDATYYFAAAEAVSEDGVECPSQITDPRAVIDALRREIGI